MRRVIDSGGGVTTTFHYDPDGDKTIIETSQDVEPILEQNRRAQSLNDGYSPSRELKRVASIPLVVVQKWMQDDGVNFLALGKQEKRAYLRRKLNDPEWQYLRTSPGKM